MKRVTTYLFLAILLIISACQTKVNFDAVNLRCEYLENPLVIESQSPRFSWEVIAQDSGFVQTAYEIQLSMDEKSLGGSSLQSWNTGKVPGNQTNQINYEGSALLPNTSYCWRVRLWDKNEQKSEWSQIASFHTGMDAKTWSAKWIGKPVDKREYTDFTIPPSPLLRKEFNNDKTISKAYLFASAKGVYEVFLNGDKIGDQVLAPGWTDYAKRIQYQVYDLTHEIKNNQNCLSVILSDGWYAGRLGSIDFSFPDYPWRGWYGRDLRFIGQLEIWYTDGSRETICSDESWSYFDDGPVREADLFIGETYDFNYEQDAWQEPGFSEDGWRAVTVEEPEYNMLVAQPDQAVKIIRQVKPLTISEPVSGVYVVDMGQNMVGWLKLQLKGEAGDTIVLKHAEMLREDGFVYRDNLRNAPQIDTYILKDNEAVWIEPVFTFHGFRYVQIEGFRSSPDLENILGQVIVSATPETGTFSCSNPMLNKLWENIRWTQWGNQISIPTDCPQRSERMGWMGDAQVFAQTGIYNHDMSAFYTKWCTDIMDAQFETGEFSDVSPRGMPIHSRFSNAPGWADAGVIVPFRIYENYGDIRILERHYESMKKYVDWIHLHNPDLLYTQVAGHAYNDWLNGNTIIAEGYPNDKGEVPPAVFNTAFFVRSTRLLAEAARILGKESDHKEYSELANNINEEFMRAYVSEDGTILGDTQAGYAIALSFNLIPHNMRPIMARKMVKALNVYDKRMSTGFISTICMMDELSKIGYHELACQLAESTRMPSWGYSIEQGATTIWERWDAFVKGRGFQNAGMNSFNHYTFGSVGEWMYRHLLGIQPDPESPGFRHFILSPKIGGDFTSVSGSYHSINGPIALDWTLQHNLLDLNIQIPANTSATFILPNGYMTEVYIDDEKLEPLPADRKVELGSGNYQVHMISK
ncbi:MAG: family 78 glycoside hydrolase catalytic domain [Bacteroidetes bacterium]|jgi:alpha-L-rhamnosidase|nr:family 78 glycoside hydrolase catalytic domain [Bacteroidota bacterium]MBT4400443.1 family 78 glycoside hydrolase catalytic domain [Bacteroidota bacterium]MBT4408206.1 family 78 glycoside hydrolase catalytic domain [Bacteroidota bacterium]MBT7091975.1 family 78 glycoside hydrolase catalytic domain [Bacteroidota bacterium]MBT7464803.1 family 78 glycoside hydrolase catalytic domain [Bacteroidota bacterium]